MVSSYILAMATYIARYEHVFIDLSYFVFHKYFGIQTWLKITKQDALPKDKMFERFKHVFRDNLEKIKIKYPFIWTNVTLVGDCPKEDIWRTQLYPIYKGGRIAYKPEVFNPEIFDYVYSNIIPELISEKGLRLITVDNAEADDIVAIAHKHIRRDTPIDKILIVTNDNDYVQLNDAYTTIINANMLEIKTRFDEEMLSVYTIWKIIKGDTSDNIPSIGKRIGDKTALKLALNEDLLNIKLQSSLDIQKQFELNKTLISFESIPKNIEDMILKKMKLI